VLQGRWIRSGFAFAARAGKAKPVSERKQSVDAAKDLTGTLRCAAASYRPF